MSESDKSVHDLAHQRIHELLLKAAKVAERAKDTPTLKVSRKQLRRQVKEHIGAAIEWIVAMDNIDRGY
jgi:hypothetical protein